MAPSSSEGGALGVLPFPVMYSGLGIRSYRGTMVDINNRRLDLLIRNNDPYAKRLVSDSHWSQRWHDRTDDQTVVKENNSDINVPVAAETTSGQNKQN